MLGVPWDVSFIFPIANYNTHNSHEVRLHRAGRSRGHSRKALLDFYSHQNPCNVLMFLQTSGASLCDIHSSSANRCTPELQLRSWPQAIKEEANSALEMSPLIFSWYLLHIWKNLGFQVIFCRSFELVPFLKRGIYFCLMVFSYQGVVSKGSVFKCVLGMSLS